MDAAVPRRPDEALVQVIMAGICNTDLEIVKGYAAFRGTLGHEFVGRVAESPDPASIGKRVVGEINAGCVRCVSPVIPDIVRSAQCWGSRIATGRLQNSFPFPFAI